MKLTAKSRYAVRAMLFLAQEENKGPQSLSRISDCGLPKDYLEQLLGSLRRSGLVAASRGAGGGYYLAKPAREIALGEIIGAVEGPLVLCECVQDAKTCSNSPECGLRGAWVNLTKGINDLMEGMTLQDLLPDVNKNIYDEGPQN